MDDVSFGIRQGEVLAVAGEDLGDVKIAELIHTAVTTGDADPEHAVSREVRAQVSELVTTFPAYPR